MYDIGMSFPPSLRLSGPSCVCFCVVSWIPPLCRGLAILSCTDTACERSADNTRSARTCFGSHCIYLHAKLVFVTAACRDTLKRSDEDGLQPAAFARLRVVYFPSRRSLPVVPFHRSHENASPFCADVSGHHFSWQPQLSHLPYRSNPTRIPLALPSRGTGPSLTPSATSKSEGATKIPNWFPTNPGTAPGCQVRAENALTWSEDTPVLHLAHLLPDCKKE